MFKCYDLLQLMCLMDAIFHSKDFSYEVHTRDIKEKSSRFACLVSFRLAAMKCIIFKIIFSDSRVESPNVKTTLTPPCSPSYSQCRIAQQSTWRYALSQELDRPQAGEAYSYYLYLEFFSSAKISDLPRQYPLTKIGHHDCSSAWEACSKLFRRCLSQSFCTGRTVHPIASFRTRIQYTVSRLR